MSGWCIVIRQDYLRGLRRNNAVEWAEVIIALAFGTRNLGADENIMIVQADSPERLEALSGWLIDHGLHMTANEKFADFAIAHGEHGLSMPCDWLSFTRTPDSGEVTFRAPCRHVEGLEEFVVESQEVAWIEQVGHGFMLDSGDDYDVWLDFTSGRTVVSLKAGSR